MDAQERIMCPSIWLYLYEHVLEAKLKLAS